MVLASIRKISGKKKLKKIQLPIAAPVDFDQIKTVGLIYYIQEETELRNVVKLLKHPFLEKKEVEMICWMKSNKKNPHPQIDNVTFVERVDFDTKFLPSSKNTRYF